MKRVPLIGLCIMVLASPALGSAASSNQTPLRLPQVLRSVRATHPNLAVAHAKITEAKGARLEGGAVFDPTLKLFGTSVVNGYYEYSQLGAIIQQQLGVGGIQVSGGYRLGSGSIPLYYGERLTRNRGEAFAGISVPLLAGRSIDSGRARLRKAHLAVNAQVAARTATWLQLARDASVAYWKWVAAGQKLVVARRMLAIARKRADQLNTRALRGALAKIVIVDAERVVLDRRGKVIEAERQFARAQASLSLYYRDANGRPIVAPESLVPARVISLPAVQTGQVSAWTRQAWTRRPELNLLSLAQRSASVDRELADNNRLPIINFNASVARDLGTGPSSLGGTDVAFGLSFELPLFRRKARGRRVRATARITNIKAQRRGVRDRIAAEVRMFAKLAALAKTRFELASARLTAAERLATAERRKFASGASDMVVVNLRELAVASAAITAIDASNEYQRALANLRLARGTTALGPVAPTSP